MRAFSAEKNNKWLRRTVRYFWSSLAFFCAGRFQVFPGIISDSSFYNDDVSLNHSLGQSLPQFVFMFFCCAVTLFYVWSYPLFYAVIWYRKCLWFLLGFCVLRCESEELWVVLDCVLWFLFWWWTCLSGFHVSVCVCVCVTD